MILSSWNGQSISSSGSFSSVRHFARVAAEEAAHVALQRLARGCAPRVHALMLFELRDHCRAFEPARCVVVEEPVPRCCVLRCAHQVDMQKPPSAGIEKPRVILRDDVAKLGDLQSGLPRAASAPALRLLCQVGRKQPVLYRLRHVTPDSELVRDVRIVECARVLTEQREPFGQPSLANEEGLMSTKPHGYAAPIR